MAVVVVIVMPVVMVVVEVVLVAVVLVVVMVLEVVVMVVLVALALVLLVLVALLEPWCGLRLWGLPCGCGRLRGAHWEDQGRLLVCMGWGPPSNPRSPPS